ncbi:MAG: hypothetical protein M1824_006247, partial [Vezdaea acicularis]
MTKRNNLNTSSPRNDNGLNIPGKRLTKQKSNGHLNGAASPSGAGFGKLAEDSQSTTKPIGRRNGATLNSEVDYSPSQVRQGAIHKPLSNGYAKHDSDGSSDYELSRAGVGNNGMGSDVQLNPKISLTASTVSRSFEGSADGVVSLVSTVLTSCPLADTIAILILLLQFNSFLVTLIQALFCAMTYATPSNAISSFNIISDFSRGFAGSPSLITIILIDGVWMIVWLFLWESLQSFFLDLAQVVMAVSLGGSYSKDSGNKTLGVCILILTLSHIFNNKDLWYGSSDSLPLEHSTPTMSDWGRKLTGGYAGLFKILLGVHIVAQGATRRVRRWLSQREVASVSTSTKKLDTEAAAGSHASGDSTNGDVTGSALQSHTASGGLPISSPIRDGKDKASVARRKRRAETEARKQQPLWAALAHTMVATTLGANEQSLAADEKSVSNATDKSGVGSAIFNIKEGKVWITNIGMNDISFQTSHFGVATFDESDDPRCNGHITTGVDKTNPFFIRVNGAEWASTRTCKSLEERTKKDMGTSWAGEIFGLTPLTAYELEFVRSSTEQVLYRTTLVTTSCTPSKDSNSTVPSPTTTIPAQAFRPSSPTTTLKTSILGAETTLNEMKAKLKRLKREHSKSLATLKNDNDKLQQRLSGSGNGDDRLRQRVLQTRQCIRQAEDAITSINSQIEALGPIPKTDSQAWKDKKESWEAERARQSAALNDFSAFKQAQDSALASIQADASAAQKDHEHLQSRIAKLNEKHARLSASNALGADEQHRRAADYAARESERARTDRKTTEQTENLENTVHELQHRTLV